MFKFFRELWPLNKPEESAREQRQRGYDVAFHNLPHPRERATMSAERLAILLSEQQVGTPAYILVEHELNCRVQRVQADAAARASHVGLVGVVIGVILTALVAILITWLQKDDGVKAGADQKKTATEADPTGAAKVDGDRNISSGMPSVVIFIENQQPPAEKQKATAKK